MGLLPRMLLLLALPTPGTPPPPPPRGAAGAPLISRGWVGPPAVPDGCCWLPQNLSCCRPEAPLMSAAAAAAGLLRLLHLRTAQHSAEQQACHLLACVCGQPKQAHTETQHTPADWCATRCDPTHMPCSNPPLGLTSKPIFLLGAPTQHMTGLPPQSTANNMIIGGSACNMANTSRPQVGAAAVVACARLFPVRTRAKMA